MKTWDGVLELARRSVVLGMLPLTVAALAGPHAAHAAAYPPLPPANGGPAISLEFRTACTGNVPYIEYAITPVGLEGQVSARLTFIDINGQTLEERIVNDLVGRTIYPGAAADSDGNGTDWPGWVLFGGQWVQDTADAHLRQGLSILVEAGSTASTAVTYVPATAPCYGPSATASSPLGGSNSVTAQGTTGSDGTITQLPTTGTSDLGSFIKVAAAALLAGLILTYSTLTRSRLETGPTSSGEAT